MTISKPKIQSNSADFENIHVKYNDLIVSKEYDNLCELFKNSKKIYVIGNGGLHYVGSHMATDLTRLVPGKVVKSFDSFGFISSNANDHGWENTFVRWLATSAILDDPKTTLVYGMSCSGNSLNIIKAFKYAHEELNFKTFMLSGRSSIKKENYTPEITLNAEYYHTVETIALMLFYDIVHRLGHACPKINR